MQMPKATNPCHRGRASMPQTRAKNRATSEIKSNMPPVLPDSKTNLIRMKTLIARKTIPDDRENHFALCLIEEKLITYSHTRRRTVELTRARGSTNSDLQKHLEKHAIAARVQRFVRHTDGREGFLFFRPHAARTVVLPNPLLLAPESICASHPVIQV
jgi:hypothetical protein